MNVPTLSAGLPRGLLLGALASSILAAIALAVVPPGATVAPTTADSSAAFPKRITARGPGFGVWTSANVNPHFGRSGFYAVPEVDGTNGQGIGAYLEFDASGNTVRRISPVQLGVQITPGQASDRFYAHQILPGATDVTIGAYQIGNNSPIFQRRLTADPAKTIIIPNTGQNERSVVTIDRNNEIEVIVIKADGSLDWAKRIGSSLFGINPVLPTDSQTAYIIPLPNGSMLLTVIKTTFNLTTFGLSQDTFVVKLSSSGAVEWARRPSIPGMFVGIPSASGNFLYFTGTSTSITNPSQPSTTVSKVTPDGNLVWARSVSGPVMAAAGDLTGDKVVLFGYYLNVGNPTAPQGDSAIAILSANGDLEAQTRFSFGAINATVAVPEGDRLWIGTVATTAGSTAAGPAHIGRAGPTLTNIQWRRFKNPANVALASPDYDSQEVAASFFTTSGGVLEVMKFEDDFAGSVNADLLPTASATTTSAGTSVAPVTLALNTFTVTESSVTPTFLTGNLTFETLTVTETSIGSGSGGGGGTPVTPTISTQPQAQTVTPGAAASFSVALNNPSSVAVTYQWSLNGAPIAGATSATLAINSAGPANVGYYSVAVTAGSTVIASQAASLQLNATIRPIGDSILFAGDIQHPNGNVYDQFLMTGTASTITADPNQIARISFVDANDDIVQVEYSGPGTLTLTLASASGPATPVNYNQPTVQYMKGRPTITIQGATEASNLGIFSVGAITGNVAVLKPGTIYNGLADVALVNIASANGRFGQMTTGNVRFSAASGDVGLNAPGVNFDRQVVIGDIDATGTANPKLVTGAVGGLAGFPGEIRIAGGDLLQANARPIEYGTAIAVRMGAGTDSHGTALPAQTNRGALQRNGQDVTASVIRGP
jgi:hypothetical protein